MSSLLGSNCCPEYYKAYSISIIGGGTRCTTRVNSIDPQLGSTPPEADFIYVLKDLFNGQSNDKIYFTYNSKSYKIDGDALNTATVYRGSSAGGTTVDTGVSGFSNSNNGLLSLSNLYLIVCLCRKADYDAMIDSSTLKIDATDHREAFGKRYNSNGYAAGASTCSRQQYFAIDLKDSNLTLNGTSGAVSATNNFSVGDYIAVAGTLRDGPSSSDSLNTAYFDGVGGVSGSRTATLAEDIFRVIDINQSEASNSIYYKDIAAYIESATIKTKAGSGNEQYFNNCTTCLQAYLGFVKGDSSASTRGLDYIIDQSDNDTLAILNDTPSAWPCRINFNRVFNVDTFNIPKALYETLRSTDGLGRTYGTKFATPIRTQDEIGTGGSVNSNEAYDLTNSKCSESHFDYLDGITGGSTDYFQFDSLSDEEVQYASDFSFGLNDLSYGRNQNFTFPPGHDTAYSNTPAGYKRYGSGFRNNRLSIGPTTPTPVGILPEGPYFKGDETTPQEEVAEAAGATTTAVTISCEYTRNVYIDQTPVASAACGDYRYSTKLPTVNSTMQYLGDTDEYDYILNSVTITTTGNMAYGDVPIVKWKDCPEGLVQPPVFHKLCDIEDGQRIAQNDAPGDPTSESRRNFFKFYQSTLDNGAQNYLKTNGPERWKNEAFGPQRVYRCSRQGKRKTTVFTGTDGVDDYVIEGTATDGDWHKPIQGLTTASHTPLIGYYPTSKSYIGRIFTLHNDGSITPFYKYDYYWQNDSAKGGHQPDGLHATNAAEARILNEDMNRNGGLPYDVVVPYAPIVEFSGGFNVNGFRKVDKLTANQETACKNYESGQGFGRTDSTDVTAADSISGCGDHSDNDCLTTCAFWPTSSHQSKITMGDKETRGDSLSGIKLCMTDYNTGDLGVEQASTYYVGGNDSQPPPGWKVRDGYFFYAPYSAQYNSTGRIDTYSPLDYCRIEVLHELQANDHCTQFDVSWLGLYGSGEIAGGGAGPSIDKLFVNNENLSVGKRWRLNDSINHAFIYPQNNGFSSFNGTTLTDQKWREENFGFTFMPQYRGNGMWYTHAQLSGDTFEKLDDLGEREGFWRRIAKPMMTADSGCVPIDSEYSDVVVTAEDPWCRGCTGCLKEIVAGDGDNYFPVGDPTDNPTTIL